MTDRQPQKTLQAMVALAEDLAAEGRVDDAGKLLEQGADRFPGLPVFDELMAAVAWTRGDQEQFAELANAAATRFDAIDPPTGPTGPNGLTASGAYAWPLRGAATIRRGPGQKPGHLGVRRRFSLQLLPLGDDLQPRPENVPMLGSDVHAWVGFGAEVLAARDGVVLRVVDRWPDQTHTGVTESDPTPTNCVVLRHDDGELSEYRCLQARSLQVKPGDRVTVGQVLARVGCSGPRPMVPHLEFRVARQTDDGMNPGLAFTFHPIQQFDAAAGKWVPVEGETVPANDLPLRAIAGD